MVARVSVACAQWRADFLNDDVRIKGGRDGFVVGCVLCFRCEDVKIKKKKDEEEGEEVFVS